MLMRKAVAEATNKCYESGWNRWRKHRAEVQKCDASQLTHEMLYNPSEAAVMDFVADLTLEAKGKPRGLSDKTIRVYLSAMKHKHALEGLPDPKEGKVRLAKLLTGVKRHAGTARKPKRPITLTLLKEMKRHVDDGTLKGKAHWAAMCMGMHGLFRLGELLPPTGSEPRRLGDIRKVSASHATVHLPRSKTDQFGKGALVNLFATGDSTCPLTALDELRKAQEAAGVAVHTATTPVFALTATKALTKPEVVAKIRKAVAALAKEHPEWGLESKDFAGHSLRRGGATSLALRGVAEPVLRLLGRWESDAVNLYIDLPVTCLEGASHMMTSEAARFRDADLKAAASPAAHGARRWILDL
jgi:hypothetical protein